MTGLDDPDLVLRFWKPYDCLTAFTDRDGRQTLADHIDVPNVYPAGRLDRDSEGLLLLPRNKALRGSSPMPRSVTLTYLVHVEGIPSDDALHHLATGVDLKDGRAFSHRGVPRFRTGAPAPTSTDPHSQVGS